MTLRYDCPVEDCDAPGPCPCEAFLYEAGGCRTCGCTDDDCYCCVQHTGMPCSWIEVDLCTACAAPEPCPGDGEAA